MDGGITRLMALVLGAMLGMVVNFSSAEARTPFGLRTFNQRSFDLNHELCFLNKDPALAAVVPGLGPLGVKKGVCQGMSAIMATAYEQIEFIPAEPGLQRTRDPEKEFLKAWRSYKRGRKPEKKFKIVGYSNLREMCESHRRFFLKQAIWINANIAVHEIASVLFDFYRVKSEPRVDLDDRLEMRETLFSIREQLEQGRLPLLLYYSHVVMVLGMNDLLEPSGQQRRVVLWVSDSNQRGVRTIEIATDLEGVPLPLYRKIWNITPSR